MNSSKKIDLVKVKKKCLSGLFDQMFSEVKKNRITGNTDKTHFRYLLREYTNVLSNF